MNHDSKVQAFLVAYENMCKEYGLCFGHEDSQGGFLIEEYSDYTMQWAQAAKDTSAPVYGCVQQIPVTDLRNVNPGQLMMHDLGHVVEARRRFYAENGSFVIEAYLAEKDARVEICNPSGWFFLGPRE